VTPICHWLEFVDWAEPVIQEPVQIKDGHALIPNRPCSGIVWNEEAIKRFAA
jgi:mandelate racemase